MLARADAPSAARTASGSGSTPWSSTAIARQRRHLPRRHHGARLRDGQGEGRRRRRAARHHARGRAERHARRRLRHLERADLSAGQLRQHRRSWSRWRRRWRRSTAPTSRTCAREERRAAARRMDEAHPHRPRRRGAGRDLPPQGVRPRATGPWPHRPIAKIDSARAAGQDVKATMYPVSRLRQQPRPPASPAGCTPTASCSRACRIPRLRARIRRR